MGTLIKGVEERGLKGLKGSDSGEGLGEVEG
jgi:hypothetical protein